jgi:hypothetical protein
MALLRARWWRVVTKVASGRAFSRWAEDRMSRAMRDARREAPR